MHGNRGPFEDANARGMFLNIGLDTGKTHMIRAVYEGICYHMRWMLELSDRKFASSQVVRYVGGGALSPVGCQIMADILGRKIETVNNPQDVGAVGAAVVAAVGLGALENLERADSLIPPSAVYEPDYENHRAYSRYYEVFKGLYRNSKKVFAALHV
jgi:xylulokinase